MFSKQNQNNKTSAISERNRISLITFSINDIVRVTELDSYFIEFGIVVGFQYIDEEISLLVNYIEAKDLPSFFKQDGSIRSLKLHDRSYEIYNVTKDFYADYQ